MTKKTSRRSWLTKEEVQRLEEGSFYRSYEKLGAHPDKQGVWFAVWGPGADTVSVLGEFNDWKPDAHPLRRRKGGVWETHVPGATSGQKYKYRITRGMYTVDKTDPYAFGMEPPVSGGDAASGLASIVCDLDYEWGDKAWLEQRCGPDSLNRPVSIYEVHLGSWRKKGMYSMSYREIAKPLADHVEALGFTHVEFMPVMEHPFYGSWGYQVAGYYAPTFRYGSPLDFKYLVDYLHRRGIGVLLDWVPAHFATDPQALVFFDGGTLYEYDDPGMRYHPDWGTYVFDYNKPGVRNFLISNALFWIEEYHIDGLRFDAVASMLYRDYSRGKDWSPNMFGGRENLEAIDLLKKVNEMVYSHAPDVLMIAEESTAWPGVSRPTYDGGLGFLFKWNMGWMHDTLEYMEKDPVHRKHHQDRLTFPLLYTYSEHYILPLSHDEVVHGKGSLWGKMPGDAWQKAANLRLLYGHQIGHPGKKLLFMGSEFGQTSEWDHDHAVDWDALKDPLHKGMMAWVKDLYTLYRDHPALWNDQPGGFEWIDFSDEDDSTISYIRRTADRELVFLFNFTPVPRTNYRIGMPGKGRWREVLNSDAQIYGGSGVGNLGSVDTDPAPFHGRNHSVIVTLPPLAVAILEQEK
ncbi:MAG: 1,4-alpha-glucan branching protein GlgB [Bacteroidetes bacterium SB0662_bin_6]|nr:1,4-alpha-glucan branching protein GlgB [Bacteroidetes bacterium SB0668_bin_1]MYE05587.1 1,4-alpha-glucan branching protein GlgB [Bacteroidetes bacterium SB0662_bin_6]